MQLSKHNIVGKIKDSSSYFIINPLSRQADILDSVTREDLFSGTWKNRTEFIEKGYIVDPEDELKRYRTAYLDFLDRREEEEIQIFYVPNYSCNFNCSYCYQEGYHPQSVQEGTRYAKEFFSYIDQEFAGRKKYVTVFGGEPLLPGNDQKEIIQTIIEEANSRKLGLAFVTNGYALAEYVPMLKNAIVREVQVTLDGTADIHNKRRALKGGGTTFEQIVEGINASLAEGIPINLRMVIDKDNIDSLPELAKFAIQKGWTKSPVFKTQLGRNYELHYCQSNNNRLYDRVSMYEAVYSKIKEEPAILEFHRPAFSITRFLFDEGELPEPLFDSCPGCKNEWAFDYTGSIYSCTATVGKDGEKLGTFYPERTLAQDIVEVWNERDVTSIPECRSCNLQLACGGGCASVAKNSNSTLLSPDCRPVDELMGLGLGLYFKDAIQGE